MTQAFKKYVQDRSAVTDAEWQQIEAVCLVKKLRRRQYLLQEGDICVNHSYVAKGCLRTYTINEKGQEHITNFAIEDWWAADMQSLTSGQPSKFNIDALEDSVVISIPKKDFEALLAQIPSFSDMVNGILHKSFIVAQGRIHNFMSLTAEEKYRSFSKQYPELSARIPQGMIASYLGITPETLSRVRNQSLRKP